MPASAWFASAYDTDDWAFRLLTMVQMAGVLIFALGLPEMFTSIDRGDQIDNRVMVAGYVVMVAAGMTPMQVIVAATRNGAELLRMNDTGTIATGKNADLLVLDGNPAEDITNTRKISAVYLKGVKVDR